MKPIHIQKASPEHFETIARIIAVQTQNPATHCIQSDTGSDASSIQNEISRLTADAELCFALAFQNEQLLGFLGCELDEELGRGWVRGPFITQAAQDWDETAAALLDGLLAMLPPAIHCLDSFLNLANERGNRFYLAQGFHQIRLVHVYTAAPAESALEATSSCEILQPHQAQEFIRLHEAVFPRTYATGARILAKLGDEQRVFVYRRGAELLGYVYAIIDEDTGDGSVEFIGVREGARGGGIGRQLLQAALQWLFGVKQVPQATLVVNDDLANARHLYESVGFRLKYTGMHLRKDKRINS